MSLNPKRAVAELKELRELTADENGAQRVAWTDVWLKAREWFASKVKELPVEQHFDAAGNADYAWYLERTGYIDFKTGQPQFGY